MPMPILVFSVIDNSPVVTMLEFTTGSGLIVADITIHQGTAASGEYSFSISLNDITVTTDNTSLGFRGFSGNMPLYVL